MVFVGNIGNSYGIVVLRLSGGDAGAAAGRQYQDLRR